MNYYPTNFYSNYPQTQQPPYSYNYNQNQMTNYQMAQSQQNQIPGKIVDSQEVARVSDIPFGGYGIFPKADLNEIYVKMWNNNGTTNLVCFRPVVEGKTISENESEKKESDVISNINITDLFSNTNKNNEKLLEKIANLEAKIDLLYSNNTANNNVNNTNNNGIQEKMQIIKRKE